MRVFYYFVLFCVTLYSPSALSIDYEIDTASIIEQSVDIECIDWKPKGVCVFLVCRLYECSIETELFVEHYLPDFIVQTYSHPDQMLWSDMRGMMASTSEDIGSSLAQSLASIPPGGGYNTQGVQQHSSQIIFNNASVIGHPGTSLVQNAVPGYVCKSTPSITPFMPYFDSMIDFITWRTGVPEWVYPESFIPGRRELGQFNFATFVSNPAEVFRWGNIFPRIGMSVTNEFPKASALVAVRAMDIVTKRGQPHAYTPFIYSGNQGLDQQFSERRDKWQQLAPKQESGCERFGTRDTVGRSWAAHKVPGPETKENGEPKQYNGAFVWNYWHQHQCCANYPGILLKVIQ